MNDIINAKISDIFLSIQGEGPFVGQKQCFIRFFGCSFGCTFCDTKHDRFIVYTPSELISRVSEFSGNYTSISVTGGEPLEQTEFLKVFLPSVKSDIGKKIYLETNGIFYKELAEIIDFIDIISMDFKLPSSTRCKPVWNEHEKFLSIGSGKEIFVKVVITPDTDPDELKYAVDIINTIGRDIPLILQPDETIRGGVESVMDKAFELKKKARAYKKRVLVMRQYHKLMRLK